MFERMSRQFDEMNSFESPRVMRSEHQMDVDVRDGDEEFVIVADLPGFEKEDIDLAIDERTLVISTSRETHEESDDESGEYIRRERRHESMRRTLRLPETVMADDATASYKNGVLTVTIPKEQDDAEDSHRIDIE